MLLAAIARKFMVLARFQCTVCLAVAAIGLTGQSAHGGTIVLDRAVMQELNSTLEKYLGLHASMARRLSDEQIEIRIRDVILELELTRGLLGRIPPHERSHVGRLIDAAHQHFEQAVSAFGPERQFLIYFCARDKKSWVQLSGRAQDPFGSDEMRTCGIRAN